MSDDADTADASNEIGAGTPIEYHRDIPTTHLCSRNAHPLTFRDPVIKRWTEQRLAGRVLNLFAGETSLSHPDPDGDGEIITNDMDPSIDTDYSLEVGVGTDLTEHFGRETFDTVLLDPPYSTRKGREKYNGRHVDNMTELKKAVAPIVRPGGTSILLGYDSSGLGQRRGFDVNEIGVFNFTGNHHDTLAIVETKVQTQLPTDD